MVVHRYGKDALGTALPNDVVIKDIADFQRRRHATILLADKAALGFFPDDIVAQFNAFIADEDGWPCDQLAHLMLRLPAEAAVQGAFRIRASQFRHFTFPRSEEHTSELQSLMRISYAVFGWNKKKH